jgi:hypothetical protein
MTAVVQNQVVTLYLPPWTSIIPLLIGIDPDLADRPRHALERQADDLVP